MSSDKGIAFACVTADSLITRQSALLWGVVVLVSVTGGDVTFYAGRDATSGRKIARVEGIADESKPIIFAKPLLCDGGLYVDIGSNVTEATVFYEPLEG